MTSVLSDAGYSSSSYHPISSSSCSHQNNCGGKASTLSYLSRNGFLVPSGFVINSEVSEGEECQRAVSEGLEHSKNNSTIVCRSNKFACRSSFSGEDGLKHSFAGVFHSVLNVPGTETAVYESIMEVRNKSLRLLRKLCMENENTKLEFGPNGLKGGVLVQHMVDPCHHAGVAFSVNPVTGAEEVIIEVMNGLNDKLTSGESSPDNTYTISRATTIVDEEKQQQPTGWRKIYPAYIIKLVSIIYKMEKLLQYKIDLEWAEQNGNIVILQARPITTITNNRKPSSLSLLGISNNDTFHFMWSSKKVQLWFRHVQAMVYFSPNCKVIFSFFFSKSKKKAFLFKTPLLTHFFCSFFVIIIYITSAFSNSANVSSPLCPVKNMYMFIRNNDENLDGVEAWQANSTIDWIKSTVVELLENNDGLFEKLLERVERICKEQNDFYKKFKKINESGLSQLVDNDLWKHILSIIEHVGRNFANYLISEAWAANAVIEHELGRIENLTDEEKFILLTPTTPDLYFLEKEAFYKLQCEKERNGNDSVTDTDLIDHVCNFPYIGMAHRTRQDLLMYLRLRLKQQPVLENKTQDHYVEQGIKLKYLLEKKPEAKRAASRIQRLSLCRMHVKNGHAGAHFYMYPVFDELSRRFPHVSRNALETLYTCDDLCKLITTGLYLSDNDILQRNFLLWSSNLESLPVTTGSYLNFQCNKNALHVYDSLPRLTSNSLVGTVASPGEVITGRACIVYTNDGHSYEHVGKGDIVVTSMAQPYQYEMYTRCSGIITDEGGILSHAAIVARELGIPCIVGCTDAVKRIPDGSTIVMKGNVVTISTAEENY